MGARFSFRDFLPHAIGVAADISASFIALGPLTRPIALPSSSFMA
jgi:hypothetical protein